MEDKLDIGGWPLAAWVGSKGKKVPLSELKGNTMYVLARGLGTIPSIVTTQSEEDIKDARMKNADIALTTESGEVIFVPPRAALDKNIVFYELPPLKAGRRRGKKSRKSRRGLRRTKRRYT